MLRRAWPGIYTLLVYKYKSHLTFIVILGIGLPVETEGKKKKKTHSQALDVVVLRSWHSNAT
jgi:hypothetical protein